MRAMKGDLLARRMANLEAFAIRETSDSRLGWRGNPPLFPSSPYPSTTSVGAPHEPDAAAQSSSGRARSRGADSRPRRLAGAGGIKPWPKSTASCPCCCTGWIWPPGALSGRCRWSSIAAAAWAAAAVQGAAALDAMAVGQSLARSHDAERVYGLSNIGKRGSVRQLRTLKSYARAVEPASAVSVG
jgi:hypothetical protein